MSNPIPPTQGRIVLVTIADTTGRRLTVPAVVTHVHSEECISAVALSAFSDAGTDAGGTKPLTSILYSEEPNQYGRTTWRWMDYQKGQAAKTEEVVKTGVATSAFVTGAINTLTARIAKLEETIAALNAKQPERQRLPVADYMPVVETFETVTPSVIPVITPNAPVDPSLDENGVPTHELPTGGAQPVAPISEH